MARVGLSEAGVSGCGNRLLPCLLGSLGFKYGSYSANFPSNVQPVAMRYFHSFLFTIPPENDLAFTGCYQETKAKKHILIVQAIRSSSFG